MSRGLSQQKWKCTVTCEANLYYLTITFKILTRFYWSLVSICPIISPPSWYRLENCNNQWKQCSVQLIYTSDTSVHCYYHIQLKQLLSTQSDPKFNLSGIEQFLTKPVLEYWSSYLHFSSVPRLTAVSHEKHQFKITAPSHPKLHQYLCLNTKLKVSLKLQTVHLDPLWTWPLTFGENLNSLELGTAQSCAHKRERSSIVCLKMSDSATQIINV